MVIDSPLPARLESTGTLRIQVRPGTHVVTVSARHQGPAAEIRRPQPPARWPADEAWVFAAQPAIRIVTVEGVETEQQVTILKQLGCNEMQGYYFSRPLPSGRLMEFLQAPLH